MKLPSVRDFKLPKKTVLLRTNYDVPFLANRQGDKPPGRKISDCSRIVESLPTINFLRRQQAKIVILSHLGRPKGEKKRAFSLQPVATYLGKLLNKRVYLESRLERVTRDDREIVMLENLRFWPGEEKNLKSFAKKLAVLGDYLINDAFACAHRRHASIVKLPEFFPKSKRAFGLDFLEEVKVLAKVRTAPKRPVVVILGGIKKSKIEAARKMTDWADFILVGGKMVLFDGIPELVSLHRKVIGNLNKEGEDITPATVKGFKKIIARAKTVVWSGPLGAYEQQEYENGTRQVAQAVVKSKAFSVVGGGDTEAALTKFGLADKIDYISSGGGAMLTYLADGTLPGIEAIKDK